MLEGGVKNFFSYFSKLRNCLQRFILHPPQPSTLTPFSQRSILLSDQIIGISYQIASWIGLYLRGQSFCQIRSWGFPIRLLHGLPYILEVNLFVRSDHGDFPSDCFMDRLISQRSIFQSDKIMGISYQINSGVFTGGRGLKAPPFHAEADFMRFPKWYDT